MTFESSWRRGAEVLQRSAVNCRVGIIILCGTGRRTARGYCVTRGQCTHYHKQVMTLMVERTFRGSAAVRIFHHQIYQDCVHQYVFGRKIISWGEADRGQ